MRATTYLGWAWRREITLNTRCAHMPSVALAYNWLTQEIRSDLTCDLTDRDPVATVVSPTDQSSISMRITSRFSGRMSSSCFISCWTNLNLHTREFAKRLVHPDPSVNVNDNWWLLTSWDPTMKWWRLRPLDVRKRKQISFASLPWTIISNISILSYPAISHSIVLDSFSFRCRCYILSSLVNRPFWQSLDRIITPMWRRRSFLRSRLVVQNWLTPQMIYSYISSRGKKASSSVSLAVKWNLAKIIRLTGLIWWNSGGRRRRGWKTHAVFILDWVGQTIHFSLHFWRNHPIRTLWAILLQFFHRVSREPIHHRFSSWCHSISANRDQLRQRYHGWEYRQDSFAGREDWITCG